MVPVNVFYALHNGPDLVNDLAVFHRDYSGCSNNQNCGFFVFWQFLSKIWLVHPFRILFSKVAFRNQIFIFDVGFAQHKHYDLMRMQS